MLMCPFSRTHARWLCLDAREHSGSINRIQSLSGIRRNHGVRAAVDRHAEYSRKRASAARREKRLLVSDNSNPPLLLLARKRGIAQTRSAIAPSLLLMAPERFQMRRIAHSFAATAAIMLMTDRATSADAIPQHSCAAIQWNSQFLSAYPKAAAACRHVVVRNGIQFAEFEGIVSQVNHDVIQVEISDVAGIPLSTIAFLTGKDGHVVIDETGKQVNTLVRGDRLTFWIREGRFGVSPTLKDQPMLIVRPERVEQLIENLGLPEHFIDLR